MIDSLLTAETPEGVTLTLRLAGIVPRACAFGIDLLIRISIYIALANALSSFGKTGDGLLLLGIFVLEWFYPVLFEVYWKGATPGKHVLGIKAVEISGLPVGWQSSLIRNVLRTADFFPFLFGFGVLSMLFTQHFQRLGDLAAGTIVVWTQKTYSLNDSGDGIVLAPPPQLNAEEQLALITFAERVPRLSKGRAMELADIASPVSGHRGAEGIQRLLGMANYISGKR